MPQKTLQDHITPRCPETQVTGFAYDVKKFLGLRDPREAFHIFLVSLPSLQWCNHQQETEVETASQKGKKKEI